MLLFSLGFPIALFYLIAGPSKNNDNFGGTGLSAPLYYMVGLAAFGGMSAMIASGGRIAGERSVGWTRQLRVTPLSTRDYFRAKVITAYAIAITSLLVLYLRAASSLGVSLPAGRWLAMSGLMLVALLPFAALGVALGHALTVDSIGPATGGIVTLFAFLGGTWFPITSGFLYHFGQLLPSWWLVQASHVGARGARLGGQGLDRDRRVDGGRRAARALRLPARHPAGVSAWAPRGARRAELETDPTLCRAPSRPRIGPSDSDCDERESRWACSAR